MSILALTDITDELVSPVVAQGDLDEADLYLDDLVKSLDDEYDIDDVVDDAGGYITGGVGVTETMATWTAITAGSFSITIDGVAANITGLNLSAATTVTGVAALIQTAIRAVGTGGFTAATVSYNTTDKCFTITSGTTGTSSSVAALSAAPSGTDISGTSYMKCGSSEATLTAGTAMAYKLKKLLVAYVCREICARKTGAGSSAFRDQTSGDKWGDKLPHFRSLVTGLEAQMTIELITGETIASSAVGMIVTERG